MSPSPATSDLIEALLTASRALVAISAESLAEIADEVTLSQYRTLVVLQSRGPRSLQQLADELQVVPSTATRMCDRLVRKDLISREVVPDNRREVSLTITPAGAAIVSAVTKRRRRSIERIVATLSDDGRTELVSALQEFSNAAGEVPDDQWFLGWA